MLHNLCLFQQSLCDILADNIGIQKLQLNSTDLGDEVKIFSFKLTH
uniref:Uncharacterized protein n=1 Tax=Rhizophora mucronata TaxID=61149 RepID=A0A2P2LD68_RHIMU